MIGLDGLSTSRTVIQKPRHCFPIRHRVYTRESTQAGSVQGTGTTSARSRALHIAYPALAMKLRDRPKDVNPVAAIAHAFRFLQSIYFNTRKSQGIKTCIVKNFWGSASSSVANRVEVLSLTILSYAMVIIVRK